MTEALEVRGNQNDVRSLKVRMPHPPPVIGQRPAMPSEIPPAAMRFLGAAMRTHWHGQAFYALGWGVDTGGKLTGKLRASVLVRMRRGDERAIALWATPWPIPEGLPIPEPPARPLTQADQVMRDRSPEAFARLMAPYREDRVRPVPVTVKWAYELGAYWVRPAKPLGVIGGEGKSGWWSATELKTAVSRSSPVAP